MRKAILFDLDGTLLPMDMETFTKGYLSLLAKKMAPFGYDKEQLLQALWQGVAAMVKNDGTMNNEERVWQTFSQLLGEQVYEHIPLFNSFYEQEFQAAIQFTDPNPALAQAAVKAARAKAELVVLATNPLFPLCGIRTRLSWVGLTPEDFDYVSTYENSSYCKPNPAYFQEILGRIGVEAKDALMIGNDMDEDILPTQNIGLPSFLAEDCLINKKQRTIPVPHGPLASLIQQF